MAEPGADRQDGHLWLTGSSRAACAQAARRLRPEFTADCHRGLRGPWTGAGTLLRALVPRVHAVDPAVAAGHAIEILAAAPELDPLLGPVPGTLTDLAPPGERTRWYSRYRTRRIAHGIIDFLRECARLHERGRLPECTGGRPLELAFFGTDQADPTDAEFLALALRRLDPVRIRLIVCSAGAGPGVELRDALAAYAQHEDIADPGQPDAHRSGQLDGQPDQLAAAAAYVASDGTSDVPGEHEAYLRLSPGERARLHDRRAAELDQLGKTTLRLGAIPYHLSRGSSADTAAKPALRTAIAYCVGMACYDAAAELAARLGEFVAPGDEPERYQADSLLASCTSLLGRPAESEPIYLALLSRTTVPGAQVSLWYALAMLYTRLHEPDRRDHHRAMAYLSAALAIAAGLAEPGDRAFWLAYLANAKALVEMHLGDLAAALSLVTDGIERFDRELPPGSHRQHRTVLHHNRAQLLDRLGRTDEALAEYGYVIDADPHYPEYRFDRGGLLSRLDRRAEALADYEAAARLGPPFPELYYNRGDLRAVMGDRQGAVADLGYVLDLEPDYLDARVSLAALLTESGAAARAAALATEGLRITPGAPRLHCALGLALLELADYQAAWQAFSEAHALDPGLPEALADRAIAAFELGRPDDAVTDLSAALAARPGDPDLLYNRGFAHQAAGRLAEAVADYSLALAAGGADTETVRRQLAGCEHELAAAVTAGSARRPPDRPA